MKLFVTGGFDDTGLTKKTYAVDLSGYWQHCPAQGDLPVDSWSFATGMTLSTGQPLEATTSTSAMPTTSKESPGIM